MYIFDISSKNKKKQKDRIMTNKQYDFYVENRSKRSPTVKNSIKAFLTGGAICSIAECFNRLYLWLGAEQDKALLFSSLTIILITGLLTGIGVFDKIARFGGGGALVPISGFANAMAAPAIDSKTEGYVTGVCAKMFTIAGPVIVFGTISSVIYGIIYYCVSMGCF